MNDDRGLEQFGLMQNGNQSTVQPDATLVPNNGPVAGRGERSGGGLLRQAEGLPSVLCKQQQPLQKMPVWCRAWDLLHTVEPTSLRIRKLVHALHAELAPTIDLIAKASVRVVRCPVEICQSPWGCQRWRTSRRGESGLTSSTGLK